MRPILTVTLNPTVDLATTADHVAPDGKLRCATPEIDPGGGGVNVSRTITILGGHSTAFVAIGGETGDRLVRLLAEVGISLVLFNGPGETRESLAVTDTATGAQYRFVLPGPHWAARDVSRVISRIAAATMHGALVVLSGSQPPGFPTDFPARLAKRIAACGGRLLLDTSGAALHHLSAAGAPPAALLRMDAEEAEDLAGHPLTSRTDSADFAASLVRRGVARRVIVARGADGAVYADADQRLHASGLDVPVKSKVGAGDSFMGAFALGLARNDPPAQALALASAAAASSVTTEATKLCRRVDVDRMARDIRVTPV